MANKHICIDGKELQSTIPAGQWQLDITFGEDDAKIRNQNTIINLHQVRKWALVILKKLPEKISIKRK